MDEFVVLRGPEDLVESLGELRLVGAAELVSAAELVGVFELVVGERCDPDQRAQKQFLLLRVGDVPNARRFYATSWKKAEYRMASSTPQLAIQPRRELFQP